MKTSAFLLITLGLLAFSCHNREEEDLNLNKVPEGIKVLKDFTGVPQGKDGVVFSSGIVLPSYNHGCYFTSDIGWPGWANRVQGVVFDDSPAGLFKKDSKPVPAVGSFVREGIMLLLHLTDNRYLCILPLTGKTTMSWLYSEEDGSFTVKTGTMGTQKVNGDIPVLAWSCSDDIYQAIHRAWEQALSCKMIKGRTTWRSKKKYPEPFRYLGWCSWEQYRKNIDGKLLVDAARIIEGSDIPVRWFLVDDGHQEANGNSLISFNPSPEKFPDGWAPLISLRKEDKIKWFGLWHCFFGLWHNIDKQNKLYSLKDNLMPSNDGKTLIVKDDPVSIDKFYNTMIGTVKKQGFDFVKIDVQASDINRYRGHDNAVRTSVISTEALEKRCNNMMNNQLINCMAQNPACMFNTKYSAVTRVSIDYKVGILPKAVSHIHQSYIMSLFLGQTVWPDHDMFHSNDPVSGQSMAISKAMSGAPIYLSDAPNDFNRGNVMPLCYSDGFLLRPLAPAVPLPSSIFRHTFTRPDAYNVIAPLPNGCAAIVAYNLNYPGKTTIKATITPKDYTYAPAMLQPYPSPWRIPAEGLVLFDWNAGKGQQFTGEYDVQLTGFKDRLLLICPIQKGWAVVGRNDKYLSPVAIKSIQRDDNSINIKMERSGPLVIWSAKGSPEAKGTEFTNLDNGFWQADIKKGIENFTIRITR